MSAPQRPNANDVQSTVDKIKSIISTLKTSRKRQLVLDHQLQNGWPSVLDEIVQELDALNIPKEKSKAVIGNGDEITFETRCRRCDHMIDWVLPKEEHMVKRFFSSFVESKLSAPTFRYCSNCEQNTVQDYVSFQHPDITTV